MNTQEPTSSETRTDRLVPVWHVGSGGRKFIGIAAISRTRGCGNCCHDGARHPEWGTEGVEKFGHCMNMCTAADDPNPTNRWCPDHQTGTEFKNGLRRPAAPAMTLV